MVCEERKKLLRGEIPVNLASHPTVIVKKDRTAQRTALQLY